jgi:hypothetical protein
MKLSSIDFDTLQRAADVADAQMELVENAKRRSPTRRSSASSSAAWAAFAALALASLLTLTSMA